MKFKSEGEYPYVLRVETGLWSLDRSLSGTRQKEDGTLEYSPWWHLTRGE